MLSKDREAVWTSRDVLWRGYYLSPITIWSSLDWTNEDRSQFLLGGWEIIHVGQLVFAAVAISSCVGGIFLALRSGYPLVRYGRRPEYTSRGQ